MAQHTNGGNGVLPQTDRIKQTELFKAMWASGEFAEEEHVVIQIVDMRKRVAEGEDPEEVLNDEGFEPDYILDLLD